MLSLSPRDDIYFMPSFYDICASQARCRHISSAQMRGSCRPPPPFSDFFYTPTPPSCRGRQPPPAQSHATPMPLTLSFSRRCAAEYLRRRLCRTPARGCYARCRFFFFSFREMRFRQAAADEVRREPFQRPRLQRCAAPPRRRVWCDDATHDVARGFAASMR